MIGGLIVAGVGIPMNVVTINLVFTDGHYTTAQVRPDLVSVMVGAILVGIIATALAQIPWGRWLALVSAGASAVVISSAIKAERLIDVPESFWGKIGKTVLDPQPAVGFYVIVGGAGIAFVGALVILFSPRESWRNEMLRAARRKAMATPSSPGWVGAPAYVPPPAPAPGPAWMPNPAPPPPTMALPDPRPAWHPDPLGPGRWRWWSGTAWSEPEPPAAWPAPPRA